MNKNLSARLKEIVGSKYVSDDEYVRWSYSMDSNIFDVLDPTPPLVVVRPGNVDEISKILHLTNSTKTPVFARGGDTDGGGSRGEKILGKHSRITLERYG